MTKEHRSKSLPNKNIATIHILKNKLNLSDETYRTMLFENYSVSSSKDLQLSQQKELILLLNHQLRKETEGNGISEKQINYILMLSRDNIVNLLSYCSKILNRSVTSLNYLSKKDGITIINSLQRYHRN
ncbi:MAG: phage protein GemA/Gp16 family protein [Brevinema sp.]